MLGYSQNSLKGILVEKTHTPRLPRLFKVTQLLFGAATLFFVVGVLTLALAHFGVVTFENKDVGRFVFFGVISSFIFIYPGGTLHTLSEDPEKYFSDPAEKNHVLITVMWAFFTIMVLVTVLFPFLEPSNMDVSPQKIEKTRETLLPYVCMLIGTTIVSLICLVIINYYRNFYRKQKMLLTGE